MPDHSHEARHRAGEKVASGRQTTSRHQTTSKPGRVLRGLALPTAATVALMILCSGRLRSHIPQDSETNLQPECRGNDIAGGEDHRHLNEGRAPR